LQVLVTMNNHCMLKKEIKLMRLISIDLYVAGY